MNEVITEIKRINEEARQKMDENEGYVFFMLTEDPEHWESYGIHTVEELHAYFDACYEREVRKAAMYEDDLYWEERMREEEREQEAIQNSILTNGVGKLPEPEWKQQLRTLA